MIYITGDTHADFSRFKNPVLRKLKKNDALIICGDFGFIWDGSPKEKKLLKKIGKLRYNVLFVEGSHENYDLLEQYEITDWCGGKTRQISGKLRQLLRGQVYTIAEKTVFAFGGGQTDDIYELEQGSNWWAREIPSEEELNDGLSNLEKAGNKVDFIVTYEPPGENAGFSPRKRRAQPHQYLSQRHLRQRGVYGLVFRKAPFKQARSAEISRGLR